MKIKSVFIVFTIICIKMLGNTSTIPHDNRSIIFPDLIAYVKSLKPEVPIQTITLDQLKYITKTWNDTNSRPQAIALMRQELERTTAVPRLLIEWGGGGNAYHALFITSEFIVFITNTGKHVEIVKKIELSAHQSEELEQQIKKAAFFSQTLWKGLGSDIPTYCFSIWRSGQAIHTIVTYNLSRTLNYFYSKSIPESSNSTEYEFYQKTLKSVELLDYLWKFCNLSLHDI